jgi:hypothetical protein
MLLDPNEMPNLLSRGLIDFTLNSNYVKNLIYNIRASVLHLRVDPLIFGENLQKLSFDPPLIYFLQLFISQDLSSLIFSNIYRN